MQSGKFIGGGIRIVDMYGLCCHVNVTTSFETIEEAQEQATDWLGAYNNDRPNMAIGGITPAMKLKMATQFH